MASKATITEIMTPKHLTLKNMSQRHMTTNLMNLSISILSLQVAIADFLKRTKKFPII